LLGVLAGIIDIIPMIFQKLSWNANICAFAFWVVAVFIITTSSLIRKGPLKGLLISVFLLIPVGILVGLKEPKILIPMGDMTLNLGSLLGYFIDKES